MTTSNLNNRFVRGSGVYKCDNCGKMTRETGRGESIVCYSCYEEGGMENEHQDNDGVHLDYRTNEAYIPDNCPLCRK